MDDRGLEATATARLVLRFTAMEDLARAYRVEVRLHRGPDPLLDLDHAPPVPTVGWRAGKAVQYDVQVPLPMEAGLRAGDLLLLLVGFHDVAAARSVPPREAEHRRGTRVEAGRIQVPDLGPLEGEAPVAAVLAAARALAERGRRPDAWRALEIGLRRAPEDEAKSRVRDAMLALGHFAPAPPTPLEEQVVAHRIAEERRRHLRRMGGQCLDRGKLWAALRILEAIGGSLAEEADRAVLGALDAAQRAEKDATDVKVRILGQITPEDQDRAEKAAASLGTTPSLLRRAEEWFADRQFGRARYLFRKLSLAADRDLAQAARERLEALDRVWLAATPPDEQQLVEEALHHPAFARLAVVPTHKFLYIGPRRLVEAIPPASRLRFDLAYVFLTDLFGRVPNPGGDRVTVFWKELWDFGGGVGGGKTIDIGRADPEQIGYRVDTGLLYHELTHCVDDTDPIFAGHREGLANVGAVYAFEALGQEGDSLHGFETNLDAFRRDYLGRDLEYWRIHDYGPSAGFYLHFVHEYARRGSGHDWRPLRRFFREYRAAPVRDGREPYLGRALAHYLVRAFGPRAFDDLLRFRFPLVESDRQAVGRELEAFASGYVRDGLAEEFADAPNSPLPRDLLGREMVSLARSREDERARAIGEGRLGILYEWWVIGPFRAKGSDPAAVVFPPQVEFDLAREYVSDVNVCTWRRPGESPMVTREATGWVGIRFAYQDDTASYALTHVTVPGDVDAVAHLRTDDDFELFVNDRWIDGYRDRGPNGSSAIWWRGPMAPLPDMMRLPVRLHAGRNRILLKVRNRQGPAGFAFALAGTDGRPVPGLVADAGPPAPSGATKAAAAPAWRRLLRETFRSRGSAGRLDVSVGRFKVGGDTLRGEDTAGRVVWRKYSVRPGFPQDSPSNLAWLRSKETETLGDFRLTLDLALRPGQPPKIAVTFQGEGGSEGLSGWTLIVHPGGEGRVEARLERYDRLVYQTPPVEVPPPRQEDDPLPLVLTLLDGRVTATLGATTLLEAVPIRAIAGRHRLGFATWGGEPGIGALTLEAPR